MDTVRLEGEPQVGQAALHIIITHTAFYNAKLIKDTPFKPYRTYLWKYGPPYILDILRQFAWIAKHLLIRK